MLEYLFLHFFLLKTHKKKEIKGSKYKIDNVNRKNTSLKLINVLKHLVYFNDQCIVRQRELTITEQSSLAEDSKDQNQLRNVFY